MTGSGDDKKTGMDPLSEMMAQFTAMQAGVMQHFTNGAAEGFPATPPNPADLAQWAEAGRQLQATWTRFQESGAVAEPAKILSDPGPWVDAIGQWQKQIGLDSGETQQKLWQESMALWQTVLGQPGDAEGTDESTRPELPRKDRRFKDERWQNQPAFALIHQTYLMLSERLEAMAKDAAVTDPLQAEQLRFTTRVITEALSPANYAATNPMVLERTVETKGQNLVKGMQHLLADLKRGQMTHTDPEAFTLGENIATTPGKVVHETELYQLIQYSPATKQVLEIPLIIFPPWINRFYILDLNQKKSFIAWAVDQGLTVFVVSWKSADESMANVVWDDYIRAQIDAIDHVRDRLDVPSVHTIGYCVAGTTLAATLAILARRDEADKVKSATFFTAQVDFANAGDLLNFIDDKQLQLVEKAGAPKGYIDGRYLAAAFNMLRPTDLIWNYVINNYLLGEDYPAFDLLHWNGDVTNLPSKWHGEYLRDLYRDNLLVIPDRMSADGTPINLSLVETPSYVQAGKEDHIAPAKSVWEIKKHFQGPLRFILAGSGHIAGVVNPPASGKYQYWTNDGDPKTLREFRDSASETPGSWWPDWRGWLEEQDDGKVSATGKRKPGGRGDSVIEDAPGRYVKTR